jgi:tetratricopeptide (TPR) repeat protein
VQKVIDKAKAEPDNLQAQTEAGDMYAQIGRFPEAIGFYEKAQAANPNYFKANVKLGNTYFDARQFEKAAEFYEKALAINSSDVGARTDLGITFVERANPDYDRAIKEFETSLKADPKHEPTLFNLSVANFKKGDQTKAQDYLKQLEQANPTSELIAKLKQAIGNTPAS